MKKRIDQIFISNLNPRFYKTPNINESFTDHLRGTSIDAEADTLKTLLSYEGNFMHYLELLSSIVEKGFKTILDNVYVIKHTEDNDNYIVAEGNRRISALKLLNGVLVLPAIIDINNYETNENDEEDEEGKRNSNYVKMVNIIQAYKEKSNKDKEINIVLLKDDDEVYDVIYSRHITGESTGKRPWGRGKYLYDLYANNKILNFRDNPNELNALSLKWNRSKKMLYSDLKNANDIINLIDVKYKTDEEKMDFMLKSKISSLQRQFIKTSIAATRYTISDDDWNNDGFKSLIMTLFTDYSPMVIVNDEGKKIKLMSISTRIPCHHPDAGKLIKRYFEKIDIDPSNPKPLLLHLLTKEELQTEEVKFTNPKGSAFELKERERFENGLRTTGTKNVDLSVTSSYSDVSSGLDDLLDRAFQTKNEFSKAMKKVGDQMKHLDTDGIDFIHGQCFTSRTMSELIVWFILKISNNTFKKFIDVVDSSKRGKVKTVADLMSDKNIEVRQKINKFWNKKIIDVFIADFSIFTEDNSNLIFDTMKILADPQKISTFNTIIHQPFTLEEWTDSDITTLREEIRKRYLVIDKFMSVLTVLS